MCSGDTTPLSIDIRGWHATAVIFWSLSLALCPQALCILRLPLTQVWTYLVLINDSAFFLWPRPTSKLTSHHVIAVSSCLSPDLDCAPWAPAALTLGPSLNRNSVSHTLFSAPMTCPGILTLVSIPVQVARPTPIQHKCQSQHRQEAANSLPASLVPDPFQLEATLSLPQP